MFSTRILLSAALVVSLGVVGSNPAQTRKQLAAQKIAADRAWPEFFRNFRAAVAKRDRAVLRQMMTRDFFFSGGGGDDNHDGDMRDDAFKFLDDPNVRGWQAFDKALAKGAAPAPPNSSADGKKYISRVAPPAGRNTSNLATAPPWIAYFEFRDGHWYCTSFSECCD
jgi:hypothetical protein